MNKIKNKFSFLYEKKVVCAFFLILFIFFFNFCLSVTTGVNVIENAARSFLNFIADDSAHVPSIFMQSEDWVDAEKEEDLVPGSWKVEKKAEWTSINSAKITFDVTTAIKMSEYKRDIIFVLDVSGSMKGSKLLRLQQNASELADYILKDQENRISIVTFSTNSTILTNEEGNYFTNDSLEVQEKLATLEAKGGTNYAAALRNVRKILDRYEKQEGRNLIVMFLTDGYPAEESPNQVTEYLSLKEKYPFIEVNGVQYELNREEIIEQVKEISDNQYIAEEKNLKNVLMEATLSPRKFENFEITDYIDTKYFEIESVEDVASDLGVVETDLENQTVKWNLSNVLVSGNKAQMTISLKLKDGYSTVKGLYPTNTKEHLKLKLENTIIDKDYKEVPVLKNNFNVIYQANAPAGCNIIVEETKNYFIYDHINKINTVPSCPGYSFKGWEIVEEDVEQVNDTEFIMPSHSVTIGGQWTKVGINKSFNGNLVTRVNLWKQVESDYKNNQEKTGAQVEEGSQSNEYPIYYYNYGNKAETETNPHYNYVLFANKCWKIARTTETGGVKLLYYGTWEDNTCVTGTIGSSSFYPSNAIVANVSYMYDNVGGLGQSRNIVQNTEGKSHMWNYFFYYGDSVEYIDGKYVLQNAEQKLWSDSQEELKGYYSCFFAGTDSCKEVRYVAGTKGSFAYSITLSNGQKIDDVNVDIHLSDSITKNDDGSYSLNEPKTIKLLDLYDSTIENFYICSDKTSVTCSEMHYFSKSIYDGYVSSSNNYKYANDVVYENGKYKLIDTDVSPIMQFWEFTKYYNSFGKNHYTCFSTSDECEDVYYLYNAYSGGGNSFLTLTNGERVYDALNKMYGYEDYEGAEHIDINQNDSEIKIFVETWYENNLKDTEYESYLENTIFCNDRRIIDLGGYDPNGGVVSDKIVFYSYENKDLTCGNLNDKFTVNDIDDKGQSKFPIVVEGDYKAGGNGKLKYPIGLLTAGEATYMGKGNLWFGTRNTENWLLLSPWSHENGYSYSYISTVRYDGEVRWGTSSGVRPVVSLRYGVEYTNNGNGTKTNPYIIGPFVQ